MFKPQEIITIDSILSIPDIENRVFSYYIPEYSSGMKLFKSVFRVESNNSANIVRVGNTLLYKDFGEDKSLNCISFVKKLYSCDTEEALFRINVDLGLGFHNTVKSTIGSIQRDNYKLGKPSGDVVKSLKIKRRDWQQHDITYWGAYHLKIEWLESVGILPISHFFIERDSGTSICRADKYAYTFNFYFNNGCFRRKIYQPYSEYKWLSNIDNTIVQNIKHIPKSGDNLIITKGFKDALCWTKVVNIPAIASNNETTMIPTEILDKLRLRFKNIYINYDNDDTGIKYSKIYSEKYSLIEIKIPKIECVKDFSDLVKKDINLALKLKDEIFSKNN